MGQKQFVVNILLLFICGLCGGQYASESPTSTLRGSAQLEFAGSYEAFRVDDTRNEIYGLNATLLQYGLTNNFELRLGWNFQHETVHEVGIRQNNVLSVLSPFLIGAKSDIVQENRGLPLISVMADVFLPLNVGNSYKTKGIGTEMRIIAFHTLSQKTNLTYNFGVQLGDDEIAQLYIYTISYVQNFTPKWGYYFEAYGDFPSGLRSNHFWDVAVVYTPHPIVQFDALFGKGISAEQDVFINARVTVMIPNNKQSTH